MYNDRDPYEQDDAYQKQPDTYHKQPHDASYGQPYDQPYQPYQQPYEEVYYQQEYYEEPIEAPIDEVPMDDAPEIVSTSQAVNLTSTIASISLLAALFLCFADQRSQAIRRFSIQSVGLGAVHIGLAFTFWLINALLGWVPFIGYWIHIMLVVILIAITLLFLMFRVRMMFHAYRGEAHVLPVIGESLRRFE